MKYFFFFIFIVWVVLTISLSGCDKEPKYIAPEPNDTIYVDPEFKKYWYFPEGSWWVYKRTDTTAEVYDTVTVNKNFRKVSYSEKFKVTAEEIYHYLSHTSKYVLTDSNENIQRLRNLPISVNTISSTGGLFSYEYFFRWPIDYSNHEYITDTLPISLPYGNVSSVIHFTYRGLGEFWMARDIGFVKYKHNYRYFQSNYQKIPSTWELVNFHINK